MICWAPSESLEIKKMYMASDFGDIFGNHILVRGEEEDCKGSSFCSTPAKKLKNLPPAASKVMILQLRHLQDSQVAFYIDTRL